MPKPKKLNLNAVIDWMRTALGLEDWEIAVQVSDVPPEEYREQIARDQVLNQCEVKGVCHADPFYKKALIWIREEDAIATLGHEMCHVIAADLGIADDTENRFEFMWSKLGNLLATAYQTRPRGKR